MRFYPRSAKTRNDALIGPGHVSNHSPRNDQSRRDSLVRYNARYVDAVLSVAASGTAHACNESAVVAGLSRVFTSTTTFTDGDTVTVGGKTYTIQASLTNVDGNVARGADEAATLTNLARAITLGSGSGTSYAAATTANPAGLSAVSSTHTLTVTGPITGAATTIAASTVNAQAATWGTLVAALILTLTITGSDIWDGAVTSNAALLTAFPTTDGLRAALALSNFVRTSDKVLTLVVPPIAAYSISSNASYDLSLAKSLFKNASAAIAVTGAIAVTEGA